MSSTWDLAVSRMSDVSNGRRGRWASTLQATLLVGVCLSTVSAAETSTTPADEAGVLLAEEGRARAVIVWDTESTPQTDYDEVQKYLEDHLPWAIEQVTGARLEVTTTMPAEDVPAILVGRSLLPASVRKRLDDATKRFDTRILSCDGRRIYLAGASTRGDAGAIADFIHDVLGVHLYGPDPIQWCIPKRSTLRVGFEERIRTPGWVSRRPWYDGNTIPRRGELADNFWRFQAINNAGPGMRISTGHTWARILPRELFDEHPEYFAEVKGQRVPKQACISNPEVVERFVRYYDTLFDENPERETASISPNDGANYCECPRCLAMDRDLSSRLLMFFNEVGRRVAKKHPHRYLAFYAYAYNESPPRRKDLRVEPNVITVLAHYFTDKTRTIADAPFNSSQWEWLNHRLIPWRKLNTSDHFVVREYMGWWYGPWPMYRSMLAATRSYAENGVDGISREYQGRDLGTDMHMYLEMRMTADPYQDGGRLLDQALGEYYGPAVDTARRVSFEIEDALRRNTSYQGECGLLRGCPNTISSELLRNWSQLLAESRKELPEPFASRVDRDIRYLECAARYTDFFRVYRDAVLAADQHAVTAEELGDIRRLLKVWLDSQEAMVRDGLKGQRLSGSVHCT